MQSKIVFGKWEAVTLLINMICTKVFLNFPRTMVEGGGTAGWILAIYISSLAFLGFFIISRLYSRFEGKDLLDVGEYIGGNVGRIAVGLVVIAFLLYIVAVILREFSEDMKIITLTVSPISYVTLFFIAGMIVGAYVGLEAIVRLHAVAVPIIATGFMIIMIGVSPQIDMSNLLPILGNGAFDIFGKGFFRVSIFSELLFMFLIIPFLKTHKTFKAAGYTALGFSSFFLILSVFVFLTIMHYPTATESFIPIYQLARIINYGRFFQRVEPVFVLIWAAAALLYLSSAFYFLLYILQKTFKLKYYKPLIIPFAILVFNLSLLPPNLFVSIDLEVKYFRNFSWIVTFGITILLLIIAVFKKNAQKRGKTRNG